jgi:hypothetical protein
VPKYETATDGEWIKPRRKGFKLVCCDCGLAHQLNFRLVKYINGGKQIEFQAFRDNRATGQIRRARGIKITSGANRNSKSKQR